MTSTQHKSHKDLVLWQKSMRLTTEIHRLAHNLPRHELFGLSSQLRTAAVSIPSNISEGAARQTTREFVQFLYIARASSADLETQLLIAGDLGYLAANDLSAALTHSDEVGRLLNAVINGLHRRLTRTTPLAANR